uniref:Uncharacterized protein n=1 Tax=Octopus bimaculoides TaxID=37653 RepID=A0A0L8IBM8_OCTBM
MCLSLCLYNTLFYIFPILSAQTPLKSAIISQEFLKEIPKNSILDAPCLSNIQSWINLHPKYQLFLNFLSPTYSACSLMTL